MNFGDNLKKLRTSIGMSQEKLAEKVNVSRQSVSKWETVDAYPEMNNLLELCKIFHCKINDLVNDSILDVNNLDDEVKSKVISLKKEESKKMKILSKIISTFSKIGRILCYVSIPFVILAIIIIPFLVSELEVKNNEISISSSDSKISILDKGDKLVLKAGNITLGETSKDVAQTKIIDVLENNSKVLVITYVEIGFIVLIVTLVLISIILKCLETIFRNINKGDNPFTLESVHLIKKMAYMMITIIVISNLGGMIFEILLNSDLDMEIEIFDLVQILFLFSLSYIFEYGRLLSIDRNAKIYGDL